MDPSSGKFVINQKEMDHNLKMHYDLKDPWLNLVTFCKDAPFEMYGKSKRPGCISGNMQVKLNNFFFVNVASVKKGDVLCDGRTVICVVVYHNYRGYVINPFIDNYNRYGSVRDNQKCPEGISAYLPIRHQLSKHPYQWELACNCIVCLPEQNEKDVKMYNFVLSDGHTITLRSPDSPKLEFETITLGHPFTLNVVEENLIHMEGFNDGIIELDFNYF